MHEDSEAELGYVSLGLHHSIMRGVIRCQAAFL
jgi:hypothetical protein